MRIFRDPTFISSVLFTVSLLILVRTCLDAIWTKEPLFQTAGFACLANILVGLLSTWMGFVKKIRWTWYVNFIIVWVGAFPTLVLPLFQHKVALTMTETIYGAIGEPGPARIWVESIAIFITMVISLVLPIKSLFFASRRQMGN